MNNVSHVSFSPKGTYVVTWTGSDKAQGKPNLILWRTATGEVIHSWAMKRKQCWPMIQWCNDESVTSFMQQQGRVAFFLNNNFTEAPAHALAIGGMKQYWVSPSSQGFHIAAFVPVKGSTPGVMTVYKYPQFEKETIRKAFFADSIDLTWNSRGNAALLLTNQEVDSSNYYGKRALFFMNVTTKFDTRVTDEFIHDLQWNPNGNEFAVAYGAMPFTKVSLFDGAKCTKTADIEKVEARNKVLYDPHGRILCVGGFGSLNGDMDFWDLTKPELKKIGSVNAFSTCYHQWCPDSFHFLACVVSPRMKMDNAIKIYNYYGEKVYEEPVEELYQVEWKPYLRGTYPQKPIVIKATTTAAAAAAPAKYRHPHFTGKASVPGSNATAASGPTRFTPSGASRSGPVGGGPVGGGPVGNKAPKKPAGPLSEEDKKKRALEQKLQQIVVLKKKQASGATLDAQQLEKLKTEKSVREELAKLAGK
eukprot:TRINITY_DN2120_c0_g1_i1.p1 TRINITY_DN2120_c0_g1~~TRINITY_DN2120_c0_g1_i1.p1  ORF type:complete len:556 (-),score=141.74 TRINITY_DN2120_c0_g1_i1:40-1464(-)